MKKLIALFLIAAASAVGQSSEPSLSPAECSVAEARKLIEKKPSQYAGYNQLAVALSRRARETSDVNFYAQAEDALKKSLELAPQNFEAEKIRIWLLLGRHEFAAAREAATALNKRVPDDVLVYGFLTDANAELGNYKAAENAAHVASEAVMHGLAELGAGDGPVDVFDLEEAREHDRDHALDRR